MEKEKAIWQQLTAIAPKSVETFKAATTALDAGNYEEAARLYEEVFKKAPEFDPVMRRLGISFVELGRTQEGVALLEMAVQKKRSSENLISLARALAYPGEQEGTRAQKERALTLAQQAHDLNMDNDPGYPILVAQLSLDLEKEPEFRKAVKALEKKHPELMVTHYFSAVLAAADGDWFKAEAEIRKAESLGLPSEAANQFLASGVQSKATVWRYAYYSLYLVAAWAVGLVLLFGMGKVMSNRTVQLLETSDPNASDGNREGALRKFYRRLINVAGVYYYISIPVVIFLVVAVAASVTYGFFMLGRIPIGIVASLVIGALVTVFKMIRSLFIKIEAEDPGRSLREDEAPGLWALAREVAQAVGTRPIDEIRITPGTDMAVYEKGGFTERMQDRAKRILILGVGTLNDFRQDAFRAVLAHEYGHFSHRDTAGGDVALRVNADMMKFAEAMIVSGQAVWWNVAFQFLRVYHFIFRRISYGATRLQEVLADRVAVRKYGAGAFEEGLRHVIRRQVEFEDVAYWEITDAAKARRSLQNLYEIKANPDSKVEEKINEAINRPSSEDDTHPSPVERFRLASRIVANPPQATPGMVWDLFTNREGITGEMSLLIDRQVKAAHG